MISRESYLAYTQGLDAQYAEAMRLLSDFIDSFDWDVAFEVAKAQRDQVAEFACSLLDVYGTNAATLAADFYAEAALAEGVSVAEPMLADLAEAKRVYASMRAAAKHLWGGKNDVDRFRQAALASLRKYIKQASDDTMRFNAMRDGRDPSKGVRWARVPRGRETCAWCIMLASRGFDYVSEETAKGMNHGHEHCDCDVVASFDADGLEGYDHEAYYRAYASARDCVDWKDADGRHALWDAWDALGADERGKFDGYSDFQTKQIVKEMRRRDVGWMNYGTPVEIEYKKPREKLSDFEKFGVDKLSANGYKVTVRRQDDGAKGNIDLLVNRKIFEMKNVSTDSSVSSQVGRARKQWFKAGCKKPVRVVFTAKDSPMSEHQLIASLVSRKHQDEEFLLVTDAGKLVRV